MAEYKLRKRSVEAESATDGSRVRVLSGDREVLMERSDFEALFEEKQSRKSKEDES